MKINRVSNLAARGLRPGSSGRSGKSDGFLKALGGAGAGTPAGVSGAAPLQGVDALLAVQEVGERGDRDDGDARGRQRGADLLDRLDALRLALLEGRIAPPVIERLAELAAAERGRVSDPRLAEILGEIELRAAVELAKLGR